MIYTCFSLAKVSIQNNVTMNMNTPHQAMITLCLLSSTISSKYGQFWLQNKLNDNGEYAKSRLQNGRQQTNGWCRTCLVHYLYSLCLKPVFPSICQTETSCFPQSSSLTVPLYCWMCVSLQCVSSLSCFDKNWTCSASPALNICTVFLVKYVIFIHWN